MRPSSQATDIGAAHDAEIAGIDALEIPIEAHPNRAQRWWSATWPVIAAVAGFFLIWQVIVWSGWKPSYALPGPIPVFQELAENASDYLQGASVTLTRAAVGYGIAFIVGSIVGLAVIGVSVHPGRDGIDDHRIADDAVDRLVPARDPPFRTRRERRSCSSSSSAPPRRSPTA